jgi:hypothetical protein
MGLLFLLLSQLGKLAWFDHMHRTYSLDFSQYYMGGMIARTGAWDSLYPIPVGNNHFNVGYPQGSILRPRYAQIADQVGISRDEFRFAQPPPAALLYLPLTLFSVHTSLYVWTLLLTLASWGISLQAAAIYDACAAGQLVRNPLGGHRVIDRLDGWLILFICFSPLVHHCVREFNISPIIGFLVGMAVVGLIRRNGWSGPGFFFASLLKITPLVLGPLYLAMRRWGAIAACAVLGVVVLAISIGVMGNGPFLVFWRDVMPSLGNVAMVNHNKALYPTICQFLVRQSLPPAAILVLKIIQWGLLAVIIVAMFRKPMRYWHQAANVGAGAAALIAWILLFAPICWDHYVMMLMPMWGWLALRAMRSRWSLLLVAIAVALCYVPMPEPMYFDYRLSFFPFNMCWGVLLTLLIATWTIVRKQPHET